MSTFKTVVDVYNELAFRCTTVEATVGRYKHGDVVWASDVGSMRTIMHMLEVAKVSDWPVFVPIVQVETNTGNAFRKLERTEIQRAETMLTHFARSGCIANSLKQTSPGFDEWASSEPVGSFWDDLNEANLSGVDLAGGPDKTVAMTFRVDPAPQLIAISAVSDPDPAHSSPIHAIGHEAIEPDFLDEEDQAVATPLPRGWSDVMGYLHGFWGAEPRWNKDNGRFIVNTVAVGSLVFHREGAGWTWAHPRSNCEGFGGDLAEASQGALGYLQEHIREGLPSLDEVKEEKRQDIVTRFIGTGDMGGLGTGRHR